MADKGKIIKELRLREGLTQEELAKRIGTTKQTIYKYEAGIVTNIPSDRLKSIADVLGVNPVALLGLGNISIPAAYAVPILGTICCGNGIHAEQHYDGEFFVDKSIKANYALHVKGDSMIDAHIYDGDVAFLKKDYEYEDGKIYGCVYGAEESASLKKVFRADGKLILQPCNASYKALVEDPDDVYIVGELAGVYHPVK